MRGQNNLTTVKLNCFRCLLSVLQPRNYFVYTPLLPAMCAGTVEERSIVEPVRAVMGTKVGGCLSADGFRSSHAPGGQQRQ